jgi:hypothetical protein
MGAEGLSGSTDVRADRSLLRPSDSVSFVMASTSPAVDSIAAPAPVDADLSRAGLSP